MMTYKEIEGWFSFESFYNEIAENFLKDAMTIVEIGAFKGKSSAFLASKIKEKNLKVKFYVVDHWEGSEEHKRMWGIRSFFNTRSLYKTFLKNIRNCGVEDLIVPVRAPSDAAADKFADEYFDFVFIDASHDYENVKKDIIAWLPKVKKGGVIGGDDYNPNWPGVIKAVDEVLATYTIRKDKLPAWYANM